MSTMVVVVVTHRVWLLFVHFFNGSMKSTYLFPFVPPVVYALRRFLGTLTRLTIER